MSISYQAKDSQILAEQLKVQEICLKHGNPLLVVSGADIIVDIKEELDSVVMCLFKDDSTETIVPVAQADLVIQNGAGTNTAIKIVGVATAANDVIVLKYAVK